MAPTTAVIQQRDVKSAATMIQENLEFFLKRLFKRHLIPLIVDSLEDREIMRITGAPEDIQEIDNAIVDYFTNEAILEFYKKTGNYPTQGEIDMEKERARKKFQRMGTDRFLEVWKDQFDENFDVDIMVTTEEFDKEVIMKQLNDLLFAYAKMPGSNLDVNAIMRQMLDIMGLQGSSLMVKEPVPVMGGQELPNPQGGMTTAFSQQQATMPMGGTGPK